MLIVQKVFPTECQTRVEGRRSGTRMSRYCLLQKLILGLPSLQTWCRQRHCLALRVHINIVHGRRRSDNDLTVFEPTSSSLPEEGLHIHPSDLWHLYHPRRGEIGPGFLSWKNNNAVNIHSARRFIRHLLSIAG